LKLATAIYNGLKVVGEVRGDYLYIIGRGDLSRYLHYSGEPKRRNCKAFRGGAPTTTDKLRHNVL
jgi:hypothetical protein